MPPWKRKTCTVNRGVGIKGKGGLNVDLQKPGDFPSGQADLLPLAHPPSWSWNKFWFPALLSGFQMSSQPHMLFILCLLISKITAYLLSAYMWDGGSRARLGFLRGLWAPLGPSLTCLCLLASVGCAGGVSLVD